MAHEKPRLTLRGPWKDEEKLAEARQGFDLVYAEQYGPPVRKTPRGLQPHEAPEAERFLALAAGLLKLEGTLKRENLYERVSDLLHPGEWCTLECVDALLRQNGAHFKVMANGQVASRAVGNVQALASRKKAHWLPPRQWTVEELLAAYEGKQPLSELEARIEHELRELGCSEVSVRACQEGLQNGESIADIVWDLEGYYHVSDPDARRRVAELVEELAANTRLWELGGRMPEEAKSGGTRGSS